MHAVGHVSPTRSTVSFPTRSLCLDSFTHLIWGWCPYCQVQMFALFLELDESVDTPDKLLGPEFSEGDNRPSQKLIIEIHDLSIVTFQVTRQNLTFLSSTILSASVHLDYIHARYTKASTKSTSISTKEQSQHLSYPAHLSDCCIRDILLPEMVETLLAENFKELTLNL